MEEVNDLAHPSQEVMIRLLEESIWCGTENTDAMNAISENASKEKLYLREKLFPTLVPALYELLRRKQEELLCTSASQTVESSTLTESSTAPISEMLKENQMRGNNDKSYHAKSAIVSERKYGPTGNTDAITWLALYLIRNNATIPTTKTAYHPYTVVNSVALAHAHNNLKHENQMYNDNDNNNNKDGSV